MGRSIDLRDQSSFSALVLDESSPFHGIVTVSGIPLEYGARPGSDGRLDDKVPDTADDLLVEYARDDVMPAPFLVRDRRCDRFGRGEFHLLVDGRGSAVQGAAKIPGKHNTLLIWFG